MLAERVKEWTEQWRQEGLEQGIEQERPLLRRQTAHQFDADTAQHLAALLSSVRDPEPLAQIGEWIIDCPSGAARLARVQTLATA